MNRLHLLSWYYQGQDGETDARDFFIKLQGGKESFPFDCPYQVGLVHCMVDEHWCVGVLVMRGTAGDDSIEQSDKLEEWFAKCNADFSSSDNRGERVSDPSVEGTLQRNYGNHYMCIETFGTI